MTSVCVLCEVPPSGGLSSAPRVGRAFLCMGWTWYGVLFLFLFLALGRIGWGWAPDEALPYTPFVRPVGGHCSWIRRKYRLPLARGLVQVRVLSGPPLLYHEKVLIFSSSPPSALFFSTFARPLSFVTTLITITASWFLSLFFSFLALLCRRSLVFDALRCATRLRLTFFMTIILLKTPTCIYLTTLRTTTASRSLPNTFSYRPPT